MRYEFSTGLMLLFVKNFVNIMCFCPFPREENKVAHIFAALTFSQGYSLNWKDAFPDCFLPLLLDEVWVSGFVGLFNCTLA